MKKIVYLILASALIFINAKNVSTNEKEISDLILKNIECLATPEISRPNCEGIGSLDCPNHHSKVYILYYGNI